MLFKYFFTHLLQRVLVSYYRWMPVVLATHALLFHTLQIKLFFSHPLQRVLVSYYRWTPVVLTIQAFIFHALQIFFYSPFTACSRILLPMDAGSADHPSLTFPRSFPYLAFVRHRRGNSNQMPHVRRQRNIKGIGWLVKSMGMQIKCPMTAMWLKKKFDICILSWVIKRFILYRRTLAEEKILYERFIA